ncbi:hypothetical protein BGZ47_003323 [Haplosporangium gracile]|nr:hypothetical protein BGZ47_003323 [Haplosporangium gracile]
MPKLTTTLLPALDRFCPRGSRQRVPLHFKDDEAYISPFALYSNSDTYYDEYEEDYYINDPLNYHMIHYHDLEATTLIQRFPRLRDLALRDHMGNLKDLATSCPDLETIYLPTKDIVVQDINNTETATATDPLSTGYHFAKLKEFRIEGEWSSSTHQAIAELIFRPTVILELA